MREVADAPRIRAFMRALGREAHADARVYFTDGATAVLIGWRTSTIDVDIRIVPELDSLFRAIPKIKEELRINVELASPEDFIPVRPGWQDRSLFVAREGRLSFYHFDLYAQALAKIERGHAQDIEDARAMTRIGLVDPAALRTYFEEIEPRLYRYPAVAVASFLRALNDFLSKV